MAKTEKEYIELLAKARHVIKEQQEIIDQLRGQVDWALRLLDQGQAIMKDLQEANDKLMGLLKLKEA